MERIDVSGPPDGTVVETNLGHLYHTDRGGFQNARRDIGDGNPLAWNADHGELHLPPLERQVGEIELREQGCGSPVAVSPPGAVVHAAELATRMVLDAGTRELAVPATLMDVREPQDEPPYDRAGLVSSADTARAAGPQAEPAQSVRGRDESAARR